MHPALSKVNLATPIFSFMASGAWQGGARGSNLLDTEYEQVYGYRTPGRALFGGMQVSFGNDTGR